MQAYVSPARLTDLELEAWGGLLRVHASLVRQLDAELIERHGIPLSSYEVLLKLAGAPGGEMRMWEIADSVLLSPSGLTRLVDRLVRDGLVERRECPTDRRGSLAAITPEGRRVFRAVQRTHLAGVRSRFLDHFSETELRRMAALWARLLPDS